MLIVDAYHHFPDRPSYLARLATLLRPAGRLANVDWHKQASSFGPPLEHRIAREDFLADADKAGLRVISEPSSCLISTSWCSPRAERARVARSQAPAGHRVERKRPRADALARRRAGAVDGGDANVVVAALRHPRGAGGAAGGGEEAGGPTAAAITVCRSRLLAANRLAIQTDGASASVSSSPRLYRSHC